MTTAIAFQTPCEPRDFLDPLEFLLADHHRQRSLCDTLDALAEGPVDGDTPATVEAVLSYLIEVMPLHIADEEEDLFPLLARRSRPTDGFDDIVTVLRAEHQADEELFEPVIDAIRRLTDPESPVRSRHIRPVPAFAEAQRRHLAWENAVVLPLARKRLAAADLVDLGRAMAARRGLAYPD
ncbi:MAG: hemerythrin domain-containing protein [Alphaproteobacteria bacterium]|nr:hemerythrin domain-containing protein [Alphaproteobacteria bacterium]